MEYQDKSRIPAMEQDTGRENGKTSANNGIERVRRARQRHNRQQGGSGVTRKRYMIAGTVFCVAIAMILTVERVGLVSAASGDVVLIDAFPGESAGLQGGEPDSGPPQVLDAPQLTGPPQVSDAPQLMSPPQTRGVGQAPGGGRSSGTAPVQETLASSQLHAEPVYTLLGTFEITGYCSCDQCCGVKDVKLTKSETVPKSSHTVAVDPEVIPLGTRIMIDGVIYYAEDVGKAIRGQIVDIFFDSHQEALEFGRQKKKVYRVE